MSLKIEMAGKIFGRLSVIECADTLKGRMHWLCQCSCGQRKVISGKRLRAGHTKSCGCLLRDVCISRNIEMIKHGESSSGERKRASIEYTTWVSMICRCNGKTKSRNWRKYYVRRGIKVCRRWLKFENFLIDMGRRPGVGYAIERKNNDLGYSKSNCKWATAKEQANNRRRPSAKLQLKVRRAGIRPRKLWLHNYWHVRRKIVNLKCAACRRLN